MTRSMTAYAAAERQTAWGTLGCELRAVNHRFLELGTRLPDELRALEPALRERVSARVSRGKLDLTMRLRTDAQHALGVDEAALERLSALAQSLQSRFPGLTTEVTGLLQLPGVLQGPQVDAEALQAEALALLDEVLAQFLEARRREGDKLAGVDHPLELVLVDEVVVLALSLTRPRRARGERDRQAHRAVARKA